MKISKVALLMASILAVQSAYPITFAEMKAKVQAKWNKMSDKVKAMIGSTDIKDIAAKAKEMIASNDIKGLADQAKKFADMAMAAKKGIITDEMMNKIPNIASLSTEEKLALAQDIASRTAKYLANEVFSKSAGKSDAEAVEAQAIATQADQEATAAQ